MTIGSVIKKAQARRTLLIVLLSALLALTTACGGDSSADDYVKNARALLNDGNARAAYLELLNAIQTDGELAEPHFLLGRLQLETGGAWEAKSALIKASRLGWPGNEVQPLLARAYLETGELDALYSIATAALDANAMARVKAAQAGGKLSEGQRAAAQALANEALGYAENSADALMVVAQLALAANNYSGAIAALDRAVEHAPTHSRAWELLAVTHTQLGRYAAAADAYARAADSNKLAISPRLNLALLHFRAGDVEAARKDVASLQQIAPEAPATHYAAGLLHLEDAQYAEAIRALETAKPLSDHYPMIDFGLATALLYAGDMRRARELAIDYYEQYPNAVTGRKLLAALEIVNNNFDEAQELLQAVLDQNPTELETLHLMAAALARNGQGERALGTYFWIHQLQQPASVTTDGGFALVEAALIAEPLKRDDEDDKPESTIAAIANLINAKSFDAAISMAQGLRWKDTQTLNGHHVLARVYLSAGREDQARDTLASALKSDPADPVSHLILAELALREGKLARAQQLYLRILDADALHLPSLLQLAALELRDGDTMAFRSYLQQAMRAHPQAIGPRIGLATLALNEGQPEEVRELLGPLSALQKGSPQIIYLQLLTALAQTEPPLDAATVAQIAQAAPGSEEFAYLLVNAAAAQAQLAQIEPALVNALRSNPNHLPSMLALAMIAKLNKDENALRFLVQALVQLHPLPDSPVLLQLRAAAQASDAHFEEAEELAARAFASIPSTMLVLDLSSYQLAAGRPEDARETLEQWLQDNTADISARLRLAQLLEQQSELLPAAMHYGAVLKNQPDNLVALNNLAWLTRKEDPATALALIERAQKIAPDQPDVLDTLGVILGINGQHKRALDALDKALEIRPHSPDTRFHRAQTLAQLGRNQQALNEARSLLNEFSDFSTRSATQELIARIED